MLLTALFPLLSLLAVPDMASLGALRTEAPADGQCRMNPLERADFIARLNRLRAEHDLPLLAYDRIIETSAAEHSLDMAARDELSHQGSDGRNFVARLRRADYDPLLGAENVAWNQRSNSEVLVDWQASPPHRRAMLDPDVSHFGIARACSADGEPYWTLVLARPFGEA